MIDFNGFFYFLTKGLNYPSWTANVSYVTLNMIFMLILHNWIQEMLYKRNYIIFSHLNTKNKTSLFYENICNIYFSKPHKNLSMAVFNICISKPQKNIVTPGSCFHSAQNSIMRILLIRTDILFS
jgi:hypothetical protein